jgi:hypothetical protein
VIYRLISGIAGVAVVIGAVTWHRVLPAPSETLPSTMSGFLSAAVVLLGAYLLFYCLTGDWFPRLTKRRDQN